MNDFARISIAAAIILSLIVSVPWCMNNAKAGEIQTAESPVAVHPLSMNGVDKVGFNDNGVIEILVTERSLYVIDPRFNLCFYETRNPYGITAVSVPCGPFERVIK